MSRCVKISKIHYQVKKKKSEQCLTMCSLQDFKNEKRLDSHVCLCVHYETPREHWRNCRRDLCAEGWESSSREMKASTSVEFTSRQELFSVHNAWGAHLGHNPPRGGVLLLSVSPIMKSRLTGIGHLGEGVTARKSLAGPHPGILTSH